MNKKYIAVPGRLESVATDGQIAGASQVYDDDRQKSQAAINNEFESGQAYLDNKISALQKQDIEVVDVLPEVATADPKKIYRVAGTTSYTDYMLNADGSQFKAMATYAFPGIDDEPTAGSENLVKSGGMVENFKNREIDFDNAQVGFLNIDGKLNSSNVNFNTTDYIPVKAGYKFVYKGYTGPSSTTAIACGYPNKSSSNAVVILAGAGSKTIETTIVVPDGVNYVRISAANSGHASYNGRYLYRQDFNGIDEFGSGERLQDTNITSILSNDENLPRNSEIVDVLSFELPFDGGNYVLRQDGTAEGTNTKFDVTDYIPVKPNSLIYYKGYLGAQYAAICGYDANKQNPTVILPGSSSTQDTFVNVPLGVSYIRVCGANDTHEAYNGRILELHNIYSLKNFIDKESGKIAANTDAINTNKAQFGGESIVFDKKGQLQVDGTVKESLSNFDTSDYIEVNEGDIIQYKGHTGTSTTYAPIVGYNSEKGNATVLHVTQSNVPFDVTIPNGISYIRVSAANSTHSSYQGRYCKIVPRYYRYITDKIESSMEDVEEQVNEIHGTLFRTDKTSLGAVDAGSAVWSQFTTIGAHLYYIKSSTAPTQIKLYSGYGASTTLVRTLSGTDIMSVGDNVYSINITDADITGGANWMRIAGGTYSGMEIYTIDIVERLDEIDDEIAHLRSPLYGKKVAVIGDSISTISGNNTPYIKIQDSDVGNEIQSYISYLDVYGTATNEPLTPLGTTIGGVELTAEMIGTLQTFTPVAEDVGKELGTAYNYNGSGTKVWSEVMCERCGATLLANASFSGASMCSGQSGIWTFSHAFSPMTIGRCRVRDADGNYINPDVIIIYRGTNDFSHIQGGTNYSMLDEYNLTANGYPSTDVYQDNGRDRWGFRRAYYMTIKALRDAYPKAIIYCATLNVFKRVTYDRFPTRNSMYSLPEMNNVIRDIANEMGCGIIEFDKDGITFENCYSEGYITDNSDHPTHPNSKGHEVMARKAIADICHVL